jgi:hypothetical protein
LNKEKSKHIGLAQQNGFGPAFLQFVEVDKRHIKY